MKSSEQQQHGVPGRRRLARLDNRYGIWNSPECCASRHAPPAKKRRHERRNLGGILKLTKISGRKVRPSTSPSNLIRRVTSLAHSWLNTPRFDGCLDFQCQPSTKWSTNRLWGQVLRMKNKYQLSDQNISRTTWKRNWLDRLRRCAPLWAIRLTARHREQMEPLH